MLKSTQPFERRVSLGLYRAVLTAHEASTRVLAGEDLHVFDAAVQRGVSANLCEALAGMGGQAGNPFEMTFGWALARPVRRPTPPLVFTRDMIPVLGGAARRFRGNTGEQNTRIIGTVVRLHREQRTGAGQVTISGYSEADPADIRRIRMELAAEDYDRALRAHSRQLPAVAEGDLVSVGNRWRLRNVRRFNVADNPTETP